MRSKRLEEWTKPDNLLLLEGWSRSGLTQDQIAKNMGVSLATLKNWKNSNLAILTALKNKKEVADFEVENSLFKSANGYFVDETTTEKMLDVDSGKLVVVREKTVRRFIPANPTSQIFWLKNRKPEEWKDKREQKIETVDNNFKLTIQDSINDYAD